MSPGAQSNCVLLLDLPPSALGGIDLLSFTTAPRFHGVKNLPPGLHFVFAASDASLAVRHGAWFPYRQAVQPTDLGNEEEAFEESMDWSLLTSRISQTLLSRITGLNPDHWSLTSSSSAVQDLEHIPGLDMGINGMQPDKELRLLPIDLKRTWREGATGEELTKAAQDRSWALGELVEKHCQGNGIRTREWEILGELQFTFLMVLTLNNNSCLEQWKRILGLLFTCRQAVKERTHLFLELLNILRLQLSHCADMEAGMFDVNENGGGFLKPMLRKFRRSLVESDGKWKVDILDELDDLQEYLKEEFGWEFDDNFVKRGMLDLEDGERVEMDVAGVDEEEETGEYAPTVVELTPGQMKELEQNDIGYGAGNHVPSDEEEDADLEDMDTRY